MHFKRHFIVSHVSLSVLAGCLTLATANAQQPAPSSELQSLKDEVKEIKAGQKTIQNDLQEIKKLLLAQQAPPKSNIQDVTGTISIQGEPVTGDKKAKVVLIEFSEFQCPFCGRHEKNTQPSLQKEYIDTGKIRHVFRDFPLEFHKLAPKAAEATHCAGEQNKYWEMSSKLFNDQKAIAPEDLKKDAESLGLDVAKFTECLDSGKYAAEIKKDIEVGSKFGITGTPSFLIAVSEGDDSKLKAVKLIRGAQPFDVFKKELDLLLAQGKPKDTAAKAAP